jgi:hypothetical protein
VVPGGHNLKLLRERLGFTMRDVESASARIASKHKNDEFAIPASRLCDVETKGVVPSVYRLYSLAVIYRRDMRELLTWYEIDIEIPAADLELAAPPKTHLSEALTSKASIQVPIRVDPAFDTRRTSNVGRMIEQWGAVPFAYLQQFASPNFTYGYIGSEDLTMYPLLPPGTFIQVDESKDTVTEGLWRTEYERPIYFVETRTGYTCCWCTLGQDDLILQSHPLSPVPSRSLKYPQEADVVGQVVGAAVRLGEWKPIADSSRPAREPAELN